MKKLSFAVGLAAAFLSTAALAAPINWTVSGTLAGGGTMSGTFTYDPATTTYSAINITTTAGTLPGAAYTSVNPASTNALLVVNTAGGTAAGQPALALQFNPVLSATPGVRTAGGSEGSCNAGCNNFGAGVQRVVAGTANVAAAAPAAVPTMNEWMMILFGTILAGGAALYIQRRRLSA